MERDGQRFRVVALPAAGIAFHPDIRQKVHFDTLLAVPFTRFASSAGDVEAEAAGRIAAQFRFRQLRKEFPNQFEYTCIGSRIRSGGIAERLLIDANHLVDVFDPANGVVRAGNHARPMQTTREGRIQNIFDQRTFTGTARPRNPRQRAKRNFQVNVPQVVVAGTDDFEPGDLGFGIW